MKGTYPKSKPVVIALGGVAWFAVLLQLAVTLHAAMLNGRGALQGIIIFLGYFTVLTNLLVCVALTLPLLVPASPGGRFFSRSDITAGVANSILFVGLAYYFLLRNVWDPQGWQLLADILLHYAMPALYLIYWWFYFPKGALRWSSPLIWCLYPAVYLMYVLVRGAMIGSYPYGFIDPLAIGYQRTLINAVALLAGFIALGLILVTLGRLQRRITA